jgi:threonine dehydrogenase-like Zn-dependent dehydrogenase
MCALTVVPRQANSIHLEEVAPPPSEGNLLGRALALGIYGTDREIISGAYGWTPPGAQRLIIGHESLGHVEEASRKAIWWSASCAGPIRCRVRRSAIIRAVLDFAA